MNISLRIVGAAGKGTFTTGFLISKFFQKQNFNVVSTMDYPSLIKGGNNITNLRISSEKIHSDEKLCDILISFEATSLKDEVLKLKPNGILICREREKLDFLNPDIRIIKVSEEVLNKEFDLKFYNLFIFGILLGLFFKESKDILNLIELTIESKFGSKSKELKELAFNYSKLGVDYFLKNYANLSYELSVDSNLKSESLFIDGAEASVLGCIKAGVKFVAEYPMTPSTSFLTLMAKRSSDYDILTKHVEDEISAVNMVIGASFAGVRSMTATSGGGFALMSEAVGFAAMSETPLVIFECMRTGPSTGIPTYTEQGDLKFVLNSSQGEFPIIVLALGDLNECFEYSFEAFNLAEIYQIPVVVLLDKHINDTKCTVEKFDENKLKINRGKLIELSDKKLENYLRYEFTKDGISNRCLPGQEGGIHVSSSYEHDESGWTCEDGENHSKMMEKRFKKLDNISSDILMPKLYGSKDAKLTLIGWGSSKGSILDAIEKLNEEGFSVNYLHFVFLNPLPDELLDLLNCLNDTMIIEGNYTGQLKSILRERFLFNVEKTYFKYDGRPFYYEDIVEKVKEVLK